MIQSSRGEKAIQYTDIVNNIIIVLCTFVTAKCGFINMKIFNEDNFVFPSIIYN